MGLSPAMCGTPLAWSLSKGVTSLACLRKSLAQAVYRANAKCRKGIASVLGDTVTQQ